MVNNSTNINIANNHLSSQPDMYVFYRWNGKQGFVF
jgi:hypothetical protein